ncbi:MAG TPA: serine/threonine-protein kinase [Polyangiaceae bacterium]|nr:serine/threonine-protein kinase [Polyangiaceae bacterium]
MAAGRLIAQKYRLLHELGRGGMGSVWAADHLGLGTRVAVKLIDRQSPSQNALLRFEQEARAAATLRSPHVVQVLDYGVDGKTPYLVMELLEGQSLKSRLARDGLLTPGETWIVVSHVVKAISRAHEEGFVHRDLKPDNVFLIEHGEELVAKVLDFGTTKALLGPDLALTRTGAMMGTPAYASPEQIMGLGVDTRADLWSLGVMTFECLTGLLPFTRPTLQGLITAICHEPIVVPSDVADVPEGFDAWFAKAVERDPTKRFQNARELREALRPLIGPGAKCAWVGPLDGDTLRFKPRPASTLHVPTYPSPDPERRGEDRIPSAIPAGIDGKRDLRHAAILCDTSRSGASLLTRHPFRVGQPLLLTLHLESAEHGEPVQAQVTRVEPHEEAMWKFRVGVRFDEPLSDELFSLVETKARSKPGNW